VQTNSELFRSRVSVFFKTAQKILPCSQGSVDATEWVHEQRKENAFSAQDFHLGSFLLIREKMGFDYTFEILYSFRKCRRLSKPL
jgi:hypothetical protein